MSDNFKELSRFDPDSNFKLVRIGEDKPVLEVELNEMQDIADHKMQLLIKDYIGDGISGMGAITYSNGHLTIANEQCFVDGRIVEVTTLQAYLDEGDKVYLKVWEQTISANDIIKYKGNQQETREVANNLIDPRAGFETSRRVQIQYDLAKTKEDENSKYLYVGQVSDGKFLVQAPLKNREPSRKKEKFYTKSSQTIYYLNKGTYTVNTNSIDVYLDGILQDSGSDYEEIANNAIRFNNMIPGNLELVMLYSQQYNLRRSTTHHVESHTKGGDDALDITDLGDREGLITKILDRLEEVVIDGGYFNDPLVPESEDEIIDGGFF